MSSFTIRLHELIDSDTDIGLDDYPIFEESYRPGLTRKIQDHYYWYEIGYETVPMFAFAMRRKMNEIMPYYNQLYKSERLGIDPLLTTNMHTAIDTNSLIEAISSQESSSKSTGVSDTRSRAAQSETPQTALSSQGDYATAIADNTGKSTNTSDSTADSSGKDTNNSTGTTEQLTSGFNVPQAQLLTEFRNTMLNIDLSVIAELNELFMQIYDTNDTFTGSPYYLQPGLFPNLGLTGYSGLII